ncbi:hypothetical protein ACFWB0_24705 [Rhodococcus sp. NPDC060086]|uniref:hypothetical protein n=1 Tax=Rhodococcus sp. NPDC060086 TaxID=3347055 RepID=UPI003666163F
MTDERQRRPVRIPSRLFGGRVRTATLAMCFLWAGLWVLYLTLNQPVDQADQVDVPQQAVIISETPYVPFTPPAQTTEQWYPTTTTEMPSTESPTVTTTPGETPEAPGDTPAPATGTQPPTATTTDANPFRLPLIPGLPGFDGESGTEPTGEPGQ